MVNTDIVLYNTAALLCALYVLERGADVFIDHTVAIARQTAIPQSTIALLTAGAEWEELAVVVASITRKRSSLAIGNVVGSTVANVIGAFSLGLIFYKHQDDQREASFERSSQLYTLGLLCLTAVAAGLLAVNKPVPWRALGIVFISIFVVYVISISLVIASGYLKAPEDLSDSESDSDDGGSSLEERDAARPLLGEVSERTRLLDAQSKSRRGVARHCFLLLTGFVGIVISGYVLSEATSNLVDAFGISEVYAGVVLLSIATTIPEKFVAVLSGRKGHLDIMLANTVGSNVFLLTLCLGIVWAASAGEYDGGAIRPVEYLAMLGATIMLTTTLFLGSRYYRLMGCFMLIAYVGFIVVESADRRE